MILVPYPKSLAFTQGSFLFRNGQDIIIPFEEKEAIFFTARRLQDILCEFLAVEMPILIDNPRPDKKALVFKKDPAISNEGYAMEVSPEGINIRFGGCAGAFHAVSTLKQMIRQCGEAVPCLMMEDGPDYKARGIMLDISRDKIPTMETLYKFIDYMSDLKYNQLQLYIEGFSFAYPSFPEVWKRETSVTGQEIMEIDRYCRERFIELVPNQNCLGHMGPWLAREEFRDLAECPEGFEVPWTPGVVHNPMTLNPTDPRSLELVDRMTADLLPYFSSGLFNIGMDETFEIQTKQEITERIAKVFDIDPNVEFHEARGRSRDICDRKGTGQVYLDFLMSVYEIALKYDKRIMFWGDIISLHPELLCKLPEDVIALEWGYEHNHPFDEYGKMYEDAGVRFYVCPGTNCWSSVSGKTGNMAENLLNAAVNGKKHGACGYLVTDWGHDGHYNSQPAFAYGAGLSWNVENNAQMDVGGFLDKFVFLDDRAIAGRCLLELGNYYKLESFSFFGSTCIYRILTSEIEDMQAMEGVDESILDCISDYVSSLASRFGEADMQCEDAGLTGAEFLNAAKTIIHLTKAGKLKLLMKSGDNGRSDIKDLCVGLIDDITDIANEYKRLWLSRNRPGGLESSIEPFENLKSGYKKILESERI